jgi:two-component system, cell cycle sensor histidine kinase and response regulator CckA
MPDRPDLLRGLRVLIVEDEGLIAEELRERLSRMGMTVVAAVDSADAALASAVKLRPDLVLMDIRIRGDRDGVQAAADITRVVDVPIVYLTAHSDRATLDRAKSTAPFGYIVKPFQERDLLVAIELAIHRHAIERQLKASERKYVTTLTSIGDAVVAADLNGRITFMNPVAEVLTGWSLADARGLVADDVVLVARDIHGTAPVGPIAQALRENQAVRFADAPLFLFSKSNEAIPIDDCASPVVDEHGQVTGAVAAFRDIRDRRLAEDALRRAQDELHQSQKMESVGRLAAGIAHDFNNLLTVINGCGELALLTDGLDETTRGLLDSIVTAGRRAAMLTRQFLAFGQKQMLQPRVMDLSALVVDLAAMVRRVIGDNVELTAAASAPILVLADPGQLEQVIVNLAVNARDAMPDGGALTIATARTTFAAGAPGRAEVEPGRYAVLTVTDTGQGIAEAVKDRIFEPYFTTREIGKGAGLGLATVYGIVKQSDGFIEFDSEPGRGTTFRIYMPLVEDPSTTELPRDAAHSRVVERGKETILLVEDEASVRALLVAVLRRQGYTLIVGCDGQNALLEVERHTGPIHLIVTDVVMPGMKGPELVARLSTPDTRFRVLYVSGYTSDAVPLSPGTSFLQKPFTPAALARRVREVLDG